MMEGITSEAASFAGHNQLGKLICFYDSNSITIEGSTDKAFTEDVGKRFSAYGWQVIKAQAHNYESMRKAVSEAKQEKKKPSIIICKSVIGKGAPTLQGTAATHG
jgi:transketolase